MVVWLERKRRRSEEISGGSVGRVLSSLKEGRQVKNDIIGIKGEDSRP